MLQQHMGMPMYNDYGSQLPPQQAAAAAQHPMLAPRPVDPATMGYSSFPPQMPQPDRTQPGNTPPFYYPPGPMPVQAPTHMWQIGQLGHTEGVPVPQASADYSQVQHPVHPDESSTPQMPQTSIQYPPPITSPIGQTAEEYASNLSPVPALNAVSGRNQDISTQVCIALSLPSVCNEHAEYCFLDDSTSADYIPLSATTGTIATAIRSS
jgi:hypothetical protein